MFEITFLTQQKKSLISDQQLRAVLHQLRQRKTAATIQSGNILLKHFEFILLQNIFATL
jgi:hypothetical protein